MATILAVDDSASMRQMVSFTLKQAGYNVIEAENGQDALTKAKQGNINLVLTDVNMPVMDGIDLITACGAEGLPRVGTIMLTSRCDQTEIQEALKGLDVVLHPKPFSPSKLTDEVRSLIDIGFWIIAQRMVERKPANQLCIQRDGSPDRRLDLGVEILAERDVLVV